MVTELGVSHDHPVCTWLSGGRILTILPAVPRSRMDGPAVGGHTYCRGP
jgi:hypothetical protein